jgi:hypothetical protein
MRDQEISELIAKALATARGGSEASEDDRDFAVTFLSAHWDLECVRAENARIAAAQALFPLGTPVFEKGKDLPMVVQGSNAKGEILCQHAAEGSRTVIRRFGPSELETIDERCARVDEESRADVSKASGTS